MEESSDQQLFISEYTYSDEDNQYDRRSALDRHSSADVTDIPIVKIIENQAAQTENETNKPIVSYVQSLFRGGSVGSNVNWLSGSNAKKDQKRLNIENLGKITEPVDVIDALNRAVELKNSMYTQTVLDLITHICEQDKTKSKSANLGAEGVCSIVDHLLGMNIGNITLVEAALRAMCSLITPAVVSTSTATASIAATVNSSICSITTEAGVSTLAVLIGVLHRDTMYASYNSAGVSVMNIYTWKYIETHWILDDDLRGSVLRYLNTNSTTSVNTSTTSSTTRTACTTTTTTTTHSSTTTTTSADLFFAIDFMPPGKCSTSLYPQWCVEFNETSYKHIGSSPYIILGERIYSLNETKIGPDASQTIGVQLLVFSI